MTFEEVEKKENNFLDWVIAINLDVVEMKEWIFASWAFAAVWHNLRINLFPIYSSKKLNIFIIFLSIPPPSLPSFSILLLKRVFLQIVSNFDPFDKSPYISGIIVTKITHQLIKILIKCYSFLNGLLFQFLLSLLFASTNVFWVRITKKPLYRNSRN